MSQGSIIVFDIIPSREYTQASVRNLSFLSEKRARVAGVDVPEQYHLEFNQTHEKRLLKRSFCNEIITYIYNQSQYLYIYSPQSQRNA